MGNETYRDYAGEINASSKHLAATLMQTKNPRPVPHRRPGSYLAAGKSAVYLVGTSPRKCCHLNGANGAQQGHSAVRSQLRSPPLPRHCWPTKGRCADHAELLLSKRHQVRAEAANAHSAFGWTGRRRPVHPRSMDNGRASPKTSWKSCCRPSPRARSPSKAPSRARASACPSCRASSLCMAASSSCIRACARARKRCHPAGTPRQWKSSGLACTVEKMAATGGAR